jgi:tetratricopeptide (TPR) repeat protein
MSAVNQTPFWDATFDSGLGRIPTYFGTTGVVGTILWLFFIIFLFMKGRKIFALFAKDRITAYLGFSLFMLTLYFWSLAFFYLPNITIFAFAFLFTGVLLAFLRGEGVLGQYHIAFGGESRLAVFVTPIVVALLVGIIAGGVLLYRQTSSLVSFSEAMRAAAANNIDEAGQALVRANTLAERDLYFRSLSSLALARLQQLSQQKLPQEETTMRAKQYIDDARINSELAIKFDPTNFENYLQYGNVFATLSSLGVQNTTSFARENYEQALRLNPKSPRILFMLSNVEFTAGDRAKAKDYAYQALAQRPNFPEVLSFLVQLEMQDGNTAAAITAVNAAVVAEPTNPLFRFAFGYLLYLTNDLANATPQFEAAVGLNQSYADAKYFLGLSYALAGRTADAIQQFEGVQALNPDNKEVAEILKNLKAGNSPFAGMNVSAPSAPQVLNGAKK